MHLIGVSISCDTQDDMYLNILLSADNFAFSATLLMSRHVSTQHCLLSKIKFWIPRSTFLFFYAEQSKNSAVYMLCALKIAGFFIRSETEISLFAGASSSLKKVTKSD